MNNKNLNKQVFSFQDQIDFLKDCGIEINDDDFSSLLDINDEEDYERQEFDLLFLELSAPDKHGNYLSPNLFFLDAQPLNLDYVSIFKNLLRITQFEDKITNVVQNVFSDGIKLSFRYNSTEGVIGLQYDEYIDANILNKFSELFKHEFEDRCLFVYNPWIDRDDVYDVVVGCVDYTYFSKITKFFENKIKVQCIENQ